MYKRIRRIVTYGIIVMLIALFAVSGGYLNRICKELLASSAGAAQAVMLDGDPAPHLARIKQIYEKSAPKLRLFLDHGAVDAVGAAVATCVPLREPDALLSALSVLDAAVKHAKNIEALSADSLF